ncbi:MAG: DUF5118 domain-containing protein, partial [Chitinophagaceae bacterium]|nr:DUF5118 domain-containing protein [Chitinophagaceae bacterium]
MRLTFLGLIVAITCTVFSGCATTAKSKKTQSKTSSTMPPAGTPAPSSSTSSAGTTPKPGPKSYKAFFDSSKVRTQKGMIVVHWQDDKYYFEIPNSLLGKDFLTVTRFVRMAAGAPIYGGEEANENVLRFERGPENKVYLRTTLNIVSSPDSTKPIYRAVKNSNVDPIAAAFDIKAFNRDTSGVI